ncbi:MAG: hypothetical protein PCFJNLEI_01701 [Verrucomicrobiae bacterium]|nr:hypothetical protein [Verrucomicrobiae bacterium]
MTKQKKQPNTNVLAPVASNPAMQAAKGEIAKRAHEIYLARGGTHGCDLDDWLQAERELAPKGNRRS